MHNPKKGEFSFYHVSCMMYVTLNKVVICKKYNSSIKAMCLIDFGFYDKTCS